MAAAYKRKMISGGCWFVGGTAVTIGSIFMTSRYGVIAGGAIILGLIDFFRGLAGYLKYRG